MSEVLKQKIRKDLSRWSRKLLLCIGLEDIGKQLVGEEKWQSLYPAWRDVEQERTPDFDPSEVPEADIQDIASADLSHIDPSETPEEEGSEGKNEVLENFFHLLPYWYFINRAFGGQGLALGVGNTPEDLKNSTNPLFDAFDVNQRLNSLLLFESLKQHYAQAGLSPNLPNSLSHLQNLSLFPSDSSDTSKFPSAIYPLNSDPNQNEAIQLGLRGLSAASQEDRDQPLDLTRKNKAGEKDNEHRKSVEVSSSSGGTRSLNLLEAKITKVSPRPNARTGKGYTSQELEAALRDIQSGKLGTRRAAVIYGIPRSTLRNKVYKLGKDKSRPYFRQKNSSTNNNNSSNCVEDSEEHPRADTRIIKGDNVQVGMTDIEEKKSQLDVSSTKLVLPHASLPSLLSSQRQGDLLLDDQRLLRETGESEEDDVEVKSEEEISHEKKVLKEWLRTKLSRQGLQTQDKPTSAECVSSANQNSAVEHLSDSSDNSDFSRQDLRKDVILKIPSLINNKSSLSRVISRKKLKRRATRDEDVSHPSEYPFSLTPSHGGGTSTVSATPVNVSGENCHDWKSPKLLLDERNDSADDGDPEEKLSRMSYEKQESQLSWQSEPKDSSMTSPYMGNSVGDASITDANGKKSRPKRGKYRNYDRDALLKAVRAVQNGEMSVHRAGTFYGVPHSTLEYKVKERHLLRRPKRKGTESPKLNHKSSPESSMSGSEPPLTSRTNPGTPAVESTTSSSSLPITADLRESLSRYLNIGQGNIEGSSSNPLTSSSSPRIGLPTTGNGRSASSNNNHGKDHQDIHHHSRESLIENRSLGLGRGIISPFLNLFNLDDLIRQNLDASSLLDLTKKS